MTREKRIAKKKKFWCGGCDRIKIGQAQKCPICGYRENRKKIKM